MLTYADVCGVRDAALACLDVCRGRVQRELMLKNLRAAVGMEAPVGREEALRWTACYSAQNYLLYWYKSCVGRQLSGSATCLA
jgi:hypothetical protein